MKALVVLRSAAQASADEIIAHLAARTGAFQAPKSVEFLDAPDRRRRAR